MAGRVALFEDFREPHRACLGIDQAAKAVIAAIIDWLLATDIFDINKRDIGAIFAEVGRAADDFAGGPTHKGAGDVDMSLTAVLSMLNTRWFLQDNTSARFGEDGAAFEMIAGREIEAFEEIAEYFHVKAVIEKILADMPTFEREIEAIH